MNYDIFKGWKIGMIMGCCLTLIILNMVFLSAVEEKSVYYKISVEVRPNCYSTLTNITSLNITTITNMTNCYGMIEIFGINNNRITIIENFTNSRWKRDFSGVVMVELGNESDISGLIGRLDEYDSLYDKLETCKDSNRNVSARLYMINEDVGFRDNFTSCDTEKTKLQTNYDQKSREVTEKDNKIKEVESSLLMRTILSFIAGSAAVHFGLPYLRGRNTPGDSSEKQLPSNTPY